MVTGCDCTRIIPWKADWESGGSTEDEVRARFDDKSQRTKTGFQRVWREVNLSHFWGNSVAPNRPLSGSNAHFARIDE